MRYVEEFRDPVAAKSVLQAIEKTVEEIGAVDGIDEEKASLILAGAIEALENSSEGKSSFFLS